MATFLTNAQKTSYFPSIALNNSNGNNFTVQNRNGQVYSQTPNLLGRVPAQEPAFCAVKGRQVVSLSVGGFTSAG